MADVREFTMNSFARFLEERVAVMVPVQLMATGEVARVLERKVKGTFGSHVMADLSKATQEERERLGFTPNDPLLRDGELLRNSVESEFGPDFAAVGTAEEIQAYHEFGYVNARTGKAVPPRPVFKIAMEEAGPQVMAIMEEAVGVQLGFRASLSSSLESGESSYTADVGTIERE